MLRGAWMYSEEYDAPVFVPDPDTIHHTVQLPTGQLGILSLNDNGRPDYSGPTLHAHKECVEHLIREELDDEYEDYDDEDEY